MRPYEWLGMALVVGMILATVAMEGAKLEAAGLTLVTSSALLATPELLANLIRRRTSSVDCTRAVWTTVRAVSWVIAGVGALTSAIGVFLLLTSENDGQVLFAVGMMTLILAYSIMAVAFIARQLATAVEEARGFSPEDRLAVAGLLFIVGTTLQFLDLM